MERRNGEWAAWTNQGKPAMIYERDGYERKPRMKEGMRMTSFRLQAVRRRMEERGIGQLIVAGRQNLFYLTGSDVNPHDRLHAAVISRQEAKFMCFHLSPCTPEGFEITIYGDSDQAVPVLASLLDLTEGQLIGVDAGLSSRYLLGLQEKLGGTCFCYADCVELARCVKDEDEIRLLRQASTITDTVFEHAFSQLREGMTQLEFGDVLSKAFSDAGVGYFPGCPMVAFGSGTAEPHHVPGTYQLRQGDAVLVDTGKQIEGYYSDMTRTVFFGSVNNEQRCVYETVLAANLAAMEQVKPDATLREVHEAACQVIERAGYGAYYPHRTSHGIGIDYHEEPFDTAKRTVCLKQNMCFSIEPGIYLPGRFGVRIEDLVTVTENGYSLLNHAPKELRVLR